MSRCSAERVIGSALAALWLAGCSAGALPEAGNNVNYGGLLSVRLPVTSMTGLRFETVVRQQYDFSCGSAALATLLRYQYDDPETEQTSFLGMWRDGDKVQIRRLGFSLLDMKRYLATRGITADGYRVTIDQIVKVGIPGIALIDFNGYKHFVVVKGIDGGGLLIGDPSLGLRRETMRTFVRQWNGVFFVLNTPPRSIGKPRFNQPADLARAPKARAFGEADPLTLAALALTRPLPGEF